MTALKTLICLRLTRRSVVKLAGLIQRSNGGKLADVTATNPYRGFRYPAEVIQHAVWLYHCLSLRDVETILAARGMVVSYETIREWGLRFAPAVRQRIETATAAAWRQVAPR